MAPCQRLFRPWLEKEEERGVPIVKVSGKVTDAKIRKDFQVKSSSLSPSFSPPAEEISKFFHPAFLPPPHLPGLVDGFPKFPPSETMPFPILPPFNYFPVNPLESPFVNLVVPSEEVERVCAKRPRPKKFHCGECGSSFSNKGQLKGHLRIHTGERPFVCSHQGCGKKFTRNEELTRHRRIHSGARPFPCPLCFKRFGRKDHLKKHVRTHERPAAPQLPQFDRPIDLPQYLAALKQGGFQL